MLREALDISSRPGKDWIEMMRQFQYHIDDLDHMVVGNFLKQIPTDQSLITSDL